MAHKQPRQAAGTKRARSLDLMPLVDVAKAWNAKSGERLTRGQVWFILKTAEAKIARALKGWG